MKLHQQINTATYSNINTSESRSLYKLTMFPQRTESCSNHLTSRLTSTKTRLNSIHEL